MFSEGFTKTLFLFLNFDLLLPIATITIGTDNRWDNIIALKSSDVVVLNRKEPNSRKPTSIYKALLI